MPEQAELGSVFETMAYTVSYSAHELSQTVATITIGVLHATSQTVAESIAVRSMPGDLEPAARDAKRAAPRPTARPTPSAVPAPRVGVVLMAEQTPRAPAAKPSRPAPAKHADSGEHAGKHGPGAARQHPGPGRPRWHVGVQRPRQRRRRARHPRRADRAGHAAAARRPGTPPAAARRTPTGRVAGLPATSPD